MTWREFIESVDDRSTRIMLQTLYDRLDDRIKSLVIEFPPGTIIKFNNVDSYVVSYGLSAGKAVLILSTIDPFVDFRGAIERYTAWTREELSELNMVEFKREDMN